MAVEDSVATNLHWIRRDIRFYDNRTLTAAGTSETVLSCFVFDTQILNHLTDKDDKRLTYIYQSLEELDALLKSKGGRLLVLYGDPKVEIPRAAQEHNIGKVYAGEDWEPYAIERDKIVANELAREGRSLELIKDHVVFKGDEVLSPTGPYRVFTPYSKAWKARLVAEDIADATCDWCTLPYTGWQTLDDLPFEKIGFTEGALWLGPGEKASRERLDKFEDKMVAYSTMRDFPHGEHTSGLSVGLRFGCISPRDCVRRAIKGGSATEKWFNELIWREFYSAILFNFPKVTDTTFQPHFAEVVWPGDDSLFEAWCKGKTGYPIVDAAMRCLVSTGWMHNRLRMIVASFLSKDLLVCWRKGEAFFARYLLDFDLASNNGGWQWAASVGADAQPYFRVFNPYLQSKKFDPEGAFIREWCPELAGLGNDAIHEPDKFPMEAAAAGIFLGETYPFPIVDHSIQREKAVKLLQAAKDLASV